MGKHTCKLCFRRFPNGRALGGHMRSHVTSSGAAQLIPPAVAQQALHHADSSASSASIACGKLPALEAEEPVPAEEDEDQEDAKGASGVSYRLRENPRRSVRLVDQEFSSFAAVGEPVVVVQDHESETESPGTSVHRRRSKRRRWTGFWTSMSPPEPASSVSDTTTDEDVAICLMMLSRGSWAVKGQWEEEEEDDDEKEDHQRHSSDGSAAGVIAGSKSLKEARSRHQCSACKKVFRSYQALGGHRASYKRTGGGCVPSAAPAAEPEIYSDETAGNGRVHECPFCFRVFSSGQALGGHKRSHLMASATTTTTITIASPASTRPLPCTPPRTSPATAAAKCGDGFAFLDLNLPAPPDDDTEFSAVSDPAFIAG